MLDNIDSEVAYKSSYMRTHIYSFKPDQIVSPATDFYIEFALLTLYPDQLRKKD